MTGDLTFGALEADKNTPAHVFMCRLKGDNQFRNVYPVWNTVAQRCSGFLQQWTSFHSECNAQPSSHFLQISSDL